MDAYIPPDKLSRYLLVHRQRNDKSRFLAQAGFTMDDPSVLEAAIHRLVAENEATQDRRDEYGLYFTVTGDLHGPYGTLQVVTVWIRPHAETQVRFVTLKPAR